MWPPPVSKTGPGGISGAWKALAKTVNCKMNCVRPILIASVFALITQHCWGFSATQMKKPLEHLALPRVTCSARRIKAIFGPLVKSNIHVKGKLFFFFLLWICLSSSWDGCQKWLETVRCQSASQHGLHFIFLSLCVLRHDRSRNPSASVWGVLWSETGRWKKPEPLFLQQIWQLLCKDWGKMQLMLNLMSFLCLQTETVRSFRVLISLVTERKLGAYNFLAMH